MFEVAFIIGIYSYLIFFLGVFGLLYRNTIVVSTIIYLVLAVAYLLKNNKVTLRAVLKVKIDNISKILIAILGAQILVNLIGVFGPELSFDALWYHLTLPKLYLVGHSIFHIPGGILYYSDMPKLTEMLYVGALSFGSETIAKLIHFSFGLMVLLAIFNISRKFLSQKYSLITATIFYSSLVVGWESITAYVDLSRTFFEVGALWGFLNWMEKKNYKWLLTSGFMLGLAITTKLIALESLIIFFCLFVYEAYSKRASIIALIKNYSIFAIPAIIVPLPWLMLSFLNTGNPFYPFLDKSTGVVSNYSLPNPLHIVLDFLNIFVYSTDPISPIYLITLPLILFFVKGASTKIRIIFVYVLISLVALYFTPKIGGGRFILPYLPAFSILAAYAIWKLKDRGLRIFLIGIVILTCVSSITYRSLANKKYLPVILGKETKAHFLTNNLNFSFGDFYDTDGYFQKNIKPSDKVLLYGFHNLYYVNFPFIDSSFVKRGDRFNYIAVQNSIALPAGFTDWKEIYYNSLTKIKLYSNGGKMWVY